jgi:TonB family protein
MLVQTTRTVSTWTARALFYGGLFVVVVAAHLAFTAALRAEGWSSSMSLFASGAGVLLLVVILVNCADWVRQKRAEWRERKRLKQGLPEGPCCVVWQAGVQPDARDDEDDAAMPWEVIGPLRARYPRLARRLGVEGVAVVDFEVGAGGRVKNVHCVYAWPSDVFYEAAREAMLRVRFEPKGDRHVRFGASYKMPFVFRISGAAKVKQAGRQARQLRPTLQAAADAVEKLRGAS